MIGRIIENDIKKHVFMGKAIIIMGPRQSGKTTLVRKIAEDMNIPYHYWNADEPDIRALLSDTTSTRLMQMIGNRNLVIIDEAQRIKNIGLTLKLIVDNAHDIQIIATGSSSFELQNQINESLTGRKFEYFLLPFSFEEMVNAHGLFEEKRLLEERLIYGYYPEVVTKPEIRLELLKSLSDSYLFKDILSWAEIKKSDKLERLVQALALQIGSQINYAELGSIVGLDNETVEKYIDILEKAFIVFRLPSFSRNLRNELKKSRKIYFWDNGIRNAIINNFNPLILRNDVGALWENFVVSERRKFHFYNRVYTNCYFWRNYQQQEIDLIEEKAGTLQAYEIKWNTNKRIRFPESFVSNYPVSATDVISPANVEKFLLNRNKTND